MLPRDVSSVAVGFAIYGVYIAEQASLSSDLSLLIGVVRLKDVKKMIFLVFWVAGCGGQPQNYTVPPLPEEEIAFQGDDGPVEELDYSECTFVPRGKYASDLRCETFTLSEKLDLSSDSKTVRQNTTASLLTQYADLKTEPVEVAIGGRTALGKSFKSEEGNVSGLFVLTEVPGRGVWSAACFGKGKVSLNRCEKSIQDTAAKGGIKRLGAKKKANPIVLGQEFEMGDDCWQPVDRKIICGKNELSWTEDEAEPKNLEKEIVERFTKSAKAESIALKKQKVKCVVSGEKKSCTKMVLSKDKEAQSYVTVVSGKKLLVCSYEGDEGMGRPCNHVISF